MSALGQKRSFASGPPNVRFAPKADIRPAGAEWLLLALDSPNCSDDAHA